MVGQPRGMGTRDSYVIPPVCGVTDEGFKVDLNVWDDIEGASYHLLHLLMPSHGPLGLVWAHFIMSMEVSMSTMSAAG